MLSISAVSKSLSRKIHLLKAPQRGPVDGNPEKGGFWPPGGSLSIPQSLQEVEFIHFIDKSIKNYE
jgi:hypothetical protein